MTNERFGGTMTASDGADPIQSWAVVMPFVSCVSQGGPHDDASYVAGFEAGRIWQRLQLADGIAVCSVGPDVVHRANLAQLDLIGTQFGYTLHVEPVPAAGSLGEAAWSEWVPVSFRRPGLAEVPS